MTSRERLVAASRGAEVDRQPSLAWLNGADGVDATVVAGKSNIERGADSSVVLAEVSNPFGLALEKGIDLNKALRDNPAIGNEVLDNLVEEVRGTIAARLESGADGIFYRLHGANPQHCSPMQYGGYYLERDRELLEEVSEATLNVLFLSGEQDLYIDFVSDLPAQLFAWDSDLTKISAADVRSARKGAVASADPTSDVLLKIGRKNYLSNLEQPNLG